MINNTNYSNIPTSNKHNAGDIQSGSINFTKEGKGISSFGVNNNSKYIPRRTGGITAGESNRLRDKEVRSNYE